MKIVKCRIYLLNIPFRDAFNHYLKKRNFCDSIILELTSDSGKIGYGEGIARSYVTGETQEKCLNDLKDNLIPAIKRLEISESHPEHFLEYIDSILPESGLASRAAAELALLDLLLKSNFLNLSAILPTVQDEIIYSGVLSSDNLESCQKRIQQFKALQLTQIKIKLNGNNDLERIALARKLLGEKVSIRVDANGAFSAEQSLELIHAISEYDIVSLEQPTGKMDLEGMKWVTSKSKIPIMADESIVDLKDAEQLIKLRACNSFNLRIAKCGGLYKTLALIKLAKANHIHVQLGCFVGETAILSAVARQLAASERFDFVEGSYSTLLLQEDICEEDIVWRQGGKAQPLTGIGLGVTIKKETLKKNAKEMINV